MLPDLDLGLSVRVPGRCCCGCSIISRRYASAVVPHLKAAEVRRSFMTTTVRDQIPRSHHKGATGRFQTGDQPYPALCHCQLGQDIQFKNLETGVLDDSSRYTLRYSIFPTTRWLAATWNQRIRFWVSNRKRNRSLALANGDLKDIMGS